MLKAPFAPADFKHSRIILNAGDVFLWLSFCRSSHHDCGPYRSGRGNKIQRITRGTLTKAITCFGLTLRDCVGSADHSSVLARCVDASSEQAKHESTRTKENVF